MLFPCIAAVPTQPSPRPLRATRWPAMRSDGVRSFRMAVVSRKSRRWVQARKYRSSATKSCAVSIGPLIVVCCQAAQPTSSAANNQRHQPPLPGGLICSSQ
jgi:hypothetical protein